VGLTTKVEVNLGLVGQDLLDLLHDLGGELGEHLQGSQVLLELLGLGGAEQDSGDVLVLEAPGNRELGHGAAEAVGDDLELDDLGDVGQVLLQHFLVALVGQARVLRNTLGVLAGENTTVQGAPDGGAEAVGGGEERKVLLLHLGPDQHRVLGLL